jgi:hypothetical protein
MAETGDTGEIIDPDVLIDVDVTVPPAVVTVAVVTGCGSSGYTGRLTFLRVSSGSSTGAGRDIELGGGRSRGVLRRAFAVRD